MDVSPTRPLQQHRLVRDFVILVVMAFTLTVTTLVSTADAQPADTLGVYAGAGAPDGVAAFENHLGRPVSVVHDTLAKENWTNLIDVRWWLDQWSPTKYAQRVIYTIPMLPDSGGTLAAGASGAYNDYFRTLAQRLVAGNQGNAVLRIGPEFNGNWFKWTIAVPNGGRDFGTFWRQIVSTMRSVPGANFKFDWCPNDGSSYVGGKPMNAATAWPGDAYVDYVGLDVYDQSWSPNRADPAARWSEFLKQPNGLRWHRDFAAAHGKPMTFPEWGISNRHDGYGGGDSPYFVGQMYEWIRTHNVAYHMYFEYADSNSDYAIFGGGTPNAARRFVQLFGAGATGGSLQSLGGAGSGAATRVKAATTKQATKKKTKRCVTRTLKLKGKLVRRKGKVVRTTICAKTSKHSARRHKSAKRATSASARKKTPARKMSKTKAA
jgi:hypothetical protein